MRPNVLCVVLDAARRDSFEPYGATPGSTPAIADLAGRGVALEQVYAAGCWTVPSHAAMFTGLLPRAAGLARAPQGSPQGVRPVVESHADRLLPEVFRRAGYSTAAVSANVWIAPHSGFGTGFEDLVSINSGRQGTLHKTDLRSRLAWLVEGTRSRVDDGAAEAEAVTERWLAGDLRRPFFWFVNVVECHSPYLPPRPYNDLGLLDRVRAARENRRYATMDAGWQAVVGRLDVPPDALERMRHLYARSIRYMDDWLGRLLERMDAAKVLDDTLVVVTADHGENLGEEGRLAHVMSLDNRLLHVPFVAAGPGAPAPDEPVTSLASLPRMLAEAAGLDDHPWPADELPPGVAVSQCDPAVLAGDPRVREAGERWGASEDAMSRLTTPLSAATDGRLKLLRRGSEELLFDLEADPQEQRPQPPGGEIARSRPDAVEALRRGLEHPAATAQLDPESLSAPTPEAAEVSDLEERMRLLGYM
jgi:arylsulfatase A-like enzyme